MSNLVIEVSKRNYNRHHYRTHTLPRVLSFEGHPVVCNKGHWMVQHNDAWAPLGNVVLTKRRRAEVIVKPAPVVEPVVAQAATA